MRIISLTLRPMLGRPMLLGAPLPVAMLLVATLFLASVRAQESAVDEKAPAQTESICLMV